MEFGFQRGQIADHDLAAVDREQALLLEARQIARHQLADGADLRGQFLIARGQRDLDTAGSRLPSRCASRKRKAARRRRTVVNDSSSMIPTSRRRREPTTRSTFSATCGMREAQRVEVLLADQQDGRLVHGGRRRPDRGRRRKPAARRPSCPARRC